MNTDKHSLVAWLLLAVLAFSCGKKKATEPEQKTPAITPPVQLTTTGGYDPAASPDGQWVVFNGGGVIAKIKPDGTGLDTITDAGGGDPDWSDWTRKGNLIVIGTVATLDATTGEIQLVAYDDCYESNPVWSPDGSQIAITSRCPDRIVLISYPGGDTSSVPCDDPDGGGCDGEGPTWSGDGNWLAFEDGLQILKVPKSGDTAQVVYDGSKDDKDVSQPAWSPDGKWIAFVREDSTATSFFDSVWNFFSYGHIWVADARGESFGLWQVTTGPYSDFDPAWSPDSRFIYFSSNLPGQHRREIWKVGFSF
ncbi:MAG: hypothetical protein L0196_06075 [candidate division Zixibacteria bacterium]|nr:hypothetical protein [candidate division Zixibacteria bacterium]